MPLMETCVTVKAALGISCIKAEQQGERGFMMSDVSFPHHSKVDSVKGLQELAFTPALQSFCV